MVCLHLQEVNAVVFFRQHWTDRRLAYGSLLGISKMRLHLQTNYSCYLRFRVKNFN